MEEQPTTSPPTENVHAKQTTELKMNDLDKMSYQELRQLEEKIRRAKTVAQDREKTELLDLISKMCADKGLTVKDLIPRKKKLARVSSSMMNWGTSDVNVSNQISRNMPKYRNPENPKETWIGVGRIPRWLKNKVKTQTGGIDYDAMKKYLIP